MPAELPLSQSKALIDFKRLSSTLESQSIYTNDLSKRSSVGALDQATFNQWYGCVV